MVRDFSQHRTVMTVVMTGVMTFAMMLAKPCTPQQLVRRQDS